MKFCFNFVDRVLPDSYSMITTEAITACDLDIYDEVMISSMAATLFTVSVFLKAQWIIADYDEGVCIDSYPVEWITVKGYIEARECPCVLYGKNNEILATGSTIEYDIDHVNGTMDIKCKSILSDILDQPASNLNSVKITAWMDKYGSPENLANAKTAMYTFHDEFKKLKFPVDLEICDEVEHMWGPLAKWTQTTFDNSRSIANWYYIKYEFRHFDDKYDFIHRLACSTNCKVMYHHSKDKFILSPFSGYDSSPVPIKGHIIKENYASRESKDYGNIFSKITIQGAGSAGQSTDTKSLTSHLRKYIYYISYEIWGYADTPQIIYSGQSIILDRTKYYIQDIKYEPTTLETIKAFTANAVRWVP